MRIAFLSPASGLGGAERVLLNVLWSLRSMASDRALYLLAPEPGPLTDQASELGVEIQLVPMSTALKQSGESHMRGGRWHDWWTLARRSVSVLPSVGDHVSRLRSALNRIRPTVILSNGIKSHLAVAAIAATAPVIWHVHDFLSSRPLTHRLLRIAGRRAVGAIAVSDAVGQDVRPIVRTHPVVVVPNAIDVAEFSPDGPTADLDTLARMPPGDRSMLRVGLVATYALWKGHDVFLKAAAALTANRPDLPLRFYIVGGPIYQTKSQHSEADLRRRISELGLTSAAGLVPFQSNLGSVYRALDIVVHASTLPEPFGLTVAEAMACGRATIVSKAGGAAELFRDGIDAVGVAPNNPDILAGAIKRLGDDSHLRRLLGHSARAAAVSRFDRVRLGPQVLRAIDSILEHRAGSPSLYR